MILSTELRNVSASIHAMCGRTLISLRDLEQFSMLLGTLADLAKNLEDEVAVHRLAEAGKAGRAIVDRLATEQFAGLVKDADSKIIRPDFGGRS
ncbi:hypothetical protein GOZ83_05105 [Agrobacterium vitis]|uniref:hypothetical protein n=1 Tax=Rhizobium/Agrobacterium group TaxID=227290 RepID=UPI0012E7D751|nr:MULTISPECIES: hypothetical protein [Rhizobium/Agrobacterium group]MCF1492469.1 hypothetical protein [Allorhizobium ampelinum]MVA44459.1 hypothetical protein [Agrobacterium vitis]